MSEWIKVSDRLPDNEQIVDAWESWTGRDGKKHGVRHANIEYFHDMANPWLEDDGSLSLIDSEITHWMPLPEPPNVD